MNRVVLCALGAAVGAGIGCSLAFDLESSSGGTGAGLGQGGRGDADAGAGAPLVAKEIAAGTGHTCALLADTTVACWGAGDLGQLGDGISGKAHLRSTPARVPGLAGVT